jgi:hypothetical protein
LSAVATPQDLCQAWLGQKLAYIHNHWAGPQTLPHDSCVEIDPDRVESLIRSIALNPSDALFVGRGDEGGVLGQSASPIETCKINGIEPVAHLKATLTAIANGHPRGSVDDQLPGLDTCSLLSTKLGRHASNRACHRVRIYCSLQLKPHQMVRDECVPNRGCSGGCRSVRVNSDTATVVLAPSGVCRMGSSAPCRQAGAGLPILGTPVAIFC